MQTKKIVWLGDSRENVRQFPDEIKQSIGHALFKVQAGKVPSNAKSLKSFKPSVMEIKANFDTNTYRAIYTVKLGEELYVLHCFQKKSKQGKKTAKQDIDLIKQRLREAEQLSKTKSN